MNNQEYEQKRAECWEKFKLENLDGEVQWQPVSRYDVFCDAFDRAYALGKQEIKQEIKQEKDAEGEEMLCVKAKTVREMYAANDRLIADHAGDEIEHDSATINDMLRHLFGSECLPDNVATSEPNVDSSVGSVESLEPKPAEPKLRRGSFAYHDNVKVRITKIKANGDVIAYTKDGYRLIGRECDFEPYTESSEEASPNVNSSDIDIDELVAKGCVPDPAKQFDNILKDSFSKERRLTIAAQMMQGLICAPLVPGVDPNPPAEYLAQTAFRLADALIAKAAKGGEV